MPTETYEQFRDGVLSKSAHVLDLEKRHGHRRGGVHAVNGEAQAEPPLLGASAREEMEEDGLNPTSSLEELLAMVNRARTRPDRREGGGRGDRRPQPRGDGECQRPPRKCANCGEEHEQRACPHPAVAVADRPCWPCGKKGHASPSCPERKSKGTAKAAEDLFLVFGADMVTEQDDGFTMAKETVRPMPRTAQLGDLLATTTRNLSNAIREDKGATRRSQPAPSKTTVGSQPARSQPDIIHNRSGPADVPTTQQIAREKEGSRLQEWRDESHQTSS